MWSVTALVHALADAVAARFASVTVEGEIAGFSRAASGHCYFALKDADGSALIRCAMFRRAALLLAAPPRDGDRVEVRGRVAVYEPRGELQLVVESLRPAGAGALLEQFLRLKAKLAAEGLFDAARKRALPVYPRAVGVVTSAQAAALGDVLTALARRAPHVAVVLAPAAVQGAAAADELVRAIGAIARDGRVDVLIVARGGGAAEDLAAFNDERVVRAIAACPVPVVAGIGHEADVTLADFAADVRAATPTAAAELAAPPTAELLAQLAQIGQRLRRRVDAVLDGHAQRLDRAQLRLARPAAALRAHAGRLAVLGTRLVAAGVRAADRGHARLDAAGARLARAPAARRVAEARRLQACGERLAALDPRRVLARGYAWLSDAQGAAITSTAQLAPGDAVRAVFADGDADLRVDAVRAVPTAPATDPAPPRP